MPPADQLRGSDIGSARRRRRRRVALVAVVSVAGGLPAWWVASVFAADGWLFLSGQLAWRFTARWAALAAAVVVVLGAVCTHWATRLSPGTPERPTEADLDSLSDVERARRIGDFRRSGLKGLVVGADGRASTSQVAVVIWGVAIMFGLLLLLLVGRTPNCPGAATGPHYGSCPGSMLDGVSFAGQLGRHFPWAYLLLLGWPLALAVAARQRVFQALAAIDLETGADQDRGQPRAGSPEALAGDRLAQVKTPGTDAASIGVVAGLRDIVTDDHGRGQLLDAQYFAFTLVTVAYFLVQLTTHPVAGLPEIPPGLLALLGISGAGYLAGKVLDPVGGRTDWTVPVSAQPAPDGAEQATSVLKPAPIVAKVVTLPANLDGTTVLGTPGQVRGVAAAKPANPDRTMVLTTPEQVQGTEPTVPIKR
jgi:hypothetical protein